MCPCSRCTSSHDILDLRKYLTNDKDQVCSKVIPRKDSARMLVAIVQAAMDVATSANCFKVIADICVGGQTQKWHGRNSDREAPRSIKIRTHDRSMIICEL